MNEEGVTVISEIEKVFDNIDSVKGHSNYIRNTNEKLQYYSHINELGEMKRLLEKKLNDLKLARASSYDEIKQGIEDQIHQLNLLVQSIKRMY